MFSLISRLVNGVQGGVTSSLKGVSDVAGTVLDVVNHLNLSKFNSTYSQLESATIISIQIHYLNILKYELINMLETISPHCGLHELSNFDISDNTSLTYNYNQTNIFDINDTFEVTIS